VCAGKTLPKHLPLPASNWIPAPCRGTGGRSFTRVSVLWVKLFLGSWGLLGAPRGAAPGEGLEH